MNTIEILPVPCSTVRVSFTVALDSYRRLALLWMLTMRFLRPLAPHRAMSIRASSPECIHLRIHLLPLTNILTVSDRDWHHREPVLLLLEERQYRPCRQCRISRNHARPIAVWWVPDWLVPTCTWHWKGSSFWPSTRVASNTPLGYYTIILL